mgnify:FL=1
MNEHLIRLTLEWFRNGKRTHARMADLARHFAGASYGVNAADLEARASERVGEWEWEA